MDGRMKREPPTPAEVREARARAAHTQADAADLVNLSGSGKWSEYERGARRMDWCRWTLYLLLTDQHPRALLTQRDDGK